MNPPKISVVTICFNAVEAIERTILSVVNQSYPNIEYIVVDGGSTDGTLDVIEKYKSRIDKLISEPDRGIYDAMNKGVRLGTGDYIQFLNAGDMFHTNSSLADIVPQIACENTIVYGLANFQYALMDKVRHPYPLNEMKDRMPFSHPATFVKLSYHKEHLFDTTYRSSGDYDFFYKAYYRDHVTFQHVPVVVADFEAESGMSMTNYSLRKREDARVKGKDKDLRWRIRYWKDMCVYNVKQKLKRFIPASYLLKRRKRILESLS